MFLFVVKRFLFYWKLVALSLYRGPRDRSAPLSRRRIIILLILNTLGIGVFFTNWLCLLLDEVFYPGFKKIKIKEPFFILGVPRSGSTLLMRLLCQDRKNFTSFILWEMVFAPSIIQRRFYALLGRIDRRAGGRVTAFLRRFDRRLFASSGRIHQVGFFLPEEDSVLFLWIVSTVFLFFAYPFVDQFRDLLGFDDLVSARNKEYTMRYYAKCVQRHLYCHGPHKRLLSKNPTFAPMVGTLAGYFGDGRFLNTIRTPYEQVPSVFSLLVFFIAAFGGDFRKSLEDKHVLLDVIKVLFLNPPQALRKLDQSRYEFVIYDDLAQNIDRVVPGIYEKFGLELTGEFKAVLEREAAAAKEYKSGHKYSLEQFDLTPDDIWENFRPVFDQFGFARR